LTWGRYDNEHNCPYDIVCGTLSSWTGFEISGYFDMGIPFNAVLIDHSRIRPHVAYQMLEERIQQHSVEDMIRIRDELESKGDRVEASKWENLFGLRNMIEMTGRLENKVVFVGYSSQKPPIMGYVGDGICRAVDDFIVVGSGRKIVEDYVRDNYRTDMCLREGLGLTVDSLRRVFETGDFAGYQIAVIPKCIGPDVRLIQNLKDNQIDPEDIKYLSYTANNSPHAIRC